MRRVRVTAYLDVRNLFNFFNIFQVFTVTRDIVNRDDRQLHWSTDSSEYATQAKASGVYGPDGSVDLRFGADGNSGCAGWLAGDGSPATPSCIYLIRAEERYGDGDHLFTMGEQRSASDALYATDHGHQSFTGDPRRIRLGFEVSF